MNRAARAVGFATELAAVTVHGLLDLAFPPHDSAVDDEALADLEAEHEVTEPTRQWWLLNSDCPCDLPGVHECPQPVRPSPESTPAGDNSAGAGEPPRIPAPAEPLAEWLKPAICEVLAEHQPLDLQGRGVHCLHLDEALVCHDWADWREHVADDLAPHIVNCIASHRITTHPEKDT